MGRGDFPCPPYSFGGIFLGGQIRHMLKDTSWKRRRLRRKPWRDLRIAKTAE
jgi:hypothetical protein